MSYELENVLHSIERELDDMQARDQIFTREYFLLWRKECILRRAVRKFHKIERKLRLGWA